MATALARRVPVKHLAALMQEKGIDIPFKNERPWHYLFFDLKLDKSLRGRPPLLDELVFDWDGNIRSAKNYRNSFTPSTGLQSRARRIRAMNNCSFQRRRKMMELSSQQRSEVF